MSGALYSSMTTFYRITIMIGLLVLPMLSGAAWSEEQIETTRHADILTPFLVSTEIMLAADKDRGTDKALRCGEALASTFLIVNTLKGITHENRPDNTGKDSFPSGHAALAFASASVINTSQPGRGWIGYLAAGYVSWSRVEDRKHYWRDVIAGAVIGQVVGKQFALKNHSSAPLLAINIAF